MTPEKIRETKDWIAGIDARTISGESSPLDTLAVFRQDIVPELLAAIEERDVLIESLKTALAREGARE